MKRFRKCDTAKYRRRRQKAQIAHAQRVERRCRQEIEQARIARWTRERAEALREEYRVQEQRLVNVLAARLYQLSPEHAAEARLRHYIEFINQLWKITRI